MDLRSEYDRTWPYLEAALEHETGGPPYTKDEVWEKLANGNAFLFTAPRAAILCLPIIYPRSKKLFLWLMGGKLKDLQLIFPDLEEQARANGFSHIEGEGRKQWAGIASRYGFTPTHVMFSKKLQ